MIRKTLALGAVTLALLSNAAFASEAFYARGTGGIAPQSHAE